MPTGGLSRHRAGGHLFQSRYRDELVEDETYLWVLTRYIHLNPVHRGWCGGPSSGRGRAIPAMQATAEPAGLGCVRRTAGRPPGRGSWAAPTPKRRTGGSWLGDVDHRPLRGKRSGTTGSGQRAVRGPAPRDRPGTAPSDVRREERLLRGVGLKGLWRQHVSTTALTERNWPAVVAGVLRGPLGVRRSATYRGNAVGPRADPWRLTSRKRAQPHEDVFAFARRTSRRPS